MFICWSTGCLKRFSLAQKVTTETCICSHKDWKTHTDSYAPAGWFHDQRAHKAAEINDQRDGGNEVLRRQAEN